jgi:aminomuconate-semialdehyde/2-hydroxymuconate-6-semialdehyde dehydrogenase
LADGARPLWGGKKHAHGELYFEPTLLTDVKQDSEIVQKEVFGPVLTWQTFSDEDELVEMANGTKYGLAAVVFTRSDARAWRVSKQLVAGSLWVNCFFVRDLRAPFGGSRNSGIGREGGDWSMDFYCDIKNVSILKNSFA